MKIDLSACAPGPLMPSRGAQVRAVVDGPLALALRRAARGLLAMPFSLNIGKCTLLGNYRENNEDAIDVKQFPEMTVCIVADGMGGQRPARSPASAPSKSSRANCATR